jgi:hypothetical protein
MPTHGRLLSITIGIAVASIMSTLAYGGFLPDGAEFQINTSTLDYQRGMTARSVARMDDCGFVVVWESGAIYGDGSRTGVYAQRFGAGGAPLGTEFLVNTYTTLYQWRPAVAAAGDGRFVVV